MTETYKYKSKIATAAGAVATIITIVGQEQLINIFPGFGQYIPLLVAAATWYLSQTTENKRVEIAEQIIAEKYAKLVPTEDVDPTLEYASEDYPEVGDEDAC